MILAQRHGKSLLWAMMLKAHILPTGLPVRSIFITKGVNWISWDAETGEVETHKPKPVTHVPIPNYYYDECGSVDWDKLKCLK